MTYVQIVDDFNGIMDIDRERIIPMHSCDHMSICRFGIESREGYKSVLQVLQDWAEDLNRSQ